MSETTKKILLIIGLVAITALLGFGLYYFFSRTIPGTTTKPSGEQITTTTGQGFVPSGVRVVTTTGPNGEIITTTLPTAGTIPTVGPGYYQRETVTKLIEQPVSYTAINNKNGELRFYNENDGKFYKVENDGAVQKLSDKIFYNVSKTTWANGSDKAILEFPDQNKIIYNFEEDKQYTLPKHWEEFSFSPDDDKIAAKSIGYSEDNRWLLTVKDDGTGTSLIEPMGNNADKVTVSWSPNRSVIAFSKTGGNDLGTYRKEILLIGQNQENFKSITVEGLGFESQWSPNGEKLLYSVYSPNSNYKPELWITNASGEKIGSGRELLKLNTWANKCTFADNNILYCAVPRTLPQGAGISPSIANGTLDDLYKIDLSTGLKSPIDLGGDYSIKNIYFDKTASKLFFSDYNQTGLFEAKQ
ncbi:MAG TPA: hypothetical protein P5230_03015 [Candidatus Magasanikbacteria bacterium]|nr:hypothetical protein [Candidatus Magasanikbacteria bacterium]